MSAIAMTYILLVTHY